MIAKLAYLTSPAPDWLITILSDDDDIYQEICSQDHDYYPEYEYGD